MNKIITYLTFSGNCKEAMKFYQKCLGGELKIQTLYQTPKTEDFPEKFKKYVVHAILKKNDIVLMGTDLHDDDLIRGNTVSILLESTDEAEMKEYYNNLEIGGSATHPIDETHWGDLFGGLTDKYGHQWLFHCKR